MGGALKDGFKASAILLGWLIGFNIAAILGCIWLDVVPRRGGPALAIYGAYFVAGIFCGFFAWMGAGKWIEPTRAEYWYNGPDGWLISRKVLIAGIVTILLLTALCWPVFWMGTRIGDYDVYVPDSMSHSLTYFVSILIALWIAHYTTVPDKGGMIAVNRAERPLTHRRPRKRKKDRDPS